MSIAFKCDNCRQYYDTDYTSSHEHDEDIELGDIVLRFTFGAKPSADEAQMIAEKDARDIFNVFRGPTNVEFVTAHICDPCRGILKRQAAQVILSQERTRA